MCLAVVRTSSDTAALFCPVDKTVKSIKARSAECGISARPLTLISNVTILSSVKTTRMAFVCVRTAATKNGWFGQNSEQRAG